MGKNCGCFVALEIREHVNKETALALLQGYYGMIGRLADCTPGAAAPPRGR